MRNFFPYGMVGLGKSIETYTFQLISILKNRYWLYICILFNLYVVSIVNKITIYDGKITVLNTLWSPFLLLFGPFCFLANNAFSNSKTSLRSIHLLPAAIYAIFYTVLKFDLLPLMSEDLEEIYWFSIFLVPISLAFYSTHVIVDRTKDLTKFEPFSELLVIISCFYLIISLLYFLVVYFELILNIKLTINYCYLIYGLIGVVAIFVAVYLLMELKRNNAFPKTCSSVVPTSSYSNSKLKPEQINDYKKRIEEHFNHTQCFLQSNLSLEHISQELNIPQHSLSQVFNLYLGSNFYGYIAKYRIEYALEQLKLNRGKLKIEALAYQCGFNSRSSFVRYFKEITGCNPSGYCQKMETENFN